MNLLAKIRSLFFKQQLPQEDKFTVFLKERLRFSPTNISLYKQAFQHKSIHSKENYERLEFLGDSILDAVVCELIYFKFSEENEGELSKIKSKLVSRETLNYLAEKLQLEEMYSYNEKLSFEYFKNLGGNVLEALIGAIYLDKGYEITKQFILTKLIKPHIDWDEILRVHNFKSVLYTKGQKENFTIEFAVINENPDNFEARFEMVLLINGVPRCSAKGQSKKVAEQKLAELFLKESL